MGRIKQLHQSPLFQSLDGVELALLSQVSELKKLEAADPIFDRGDNSDSCYIILEGSVLVSAGADDATEAELRQGDAFGEFSLVAQGKRMVDAKAGIDGTTVLAISADQFKLLAENESGIGFKVLQPLLKQFSTATSVGISPLAEAMP